MSRSRQKRSRPVSSKPQAKKKTKLVKEKANVEPTRKSSRATSKVSYKNQLESESEYEENEDILSNDGDQSDNDEFDV